MARFAAAPLLAAAGAFTGAGVALALFCGTVCAARFAAAGAGVGLVVAAAAPVALLPAGAAAACAKRQAAPSRHLPLAKYRHGSFFGAGLAARLAAAALLAGAGFALAGGLLPAAGPGGLAFQSL